MQVLEGDGYSQDLGNWPKKMNDFRNYWTRNFSSAVQHCKDDVLLKNKSCEQKDGTKIRKCSTKMFKRTTPNNIIHRSWLCFSPTTGKIYCFYCKLFDESSISCFSQEGFFDWKHASERLRQHETSSIHLKSLVDFINMSKINNCIDIELKKQIESETKYWQKVLKPIVDVILHLSERGLAFRGDNETFGSPHNGNFLGSLELLAKYNPFLREHIEKYGNKGSGNVSFLSSTIYEELIDEIGNMIFCEIVSRIKKSKIYSISLDGTRDKSHIDQLTIIFRYIEGQFPVERFLLFLPNQGHKAQNMFDGLMKVLNENDISVKDCRGQSYDNTSSMSGKFNGVQALVAKENDLAIWIPCFGHSFDLANEKASDSSIASTHYFMFLQGLYVFFSASDMLWELLTKSLEAHKNSTGDRILVPKRVETTRWSSRADANKALSVGYLPIRECLLNISEDVESNKFDAKTRCEAHGLYKKMCQLEIAIMSSIWADILEQSKKTSKSVQGSQVQLNTAIACIKSFKKIVADKREQFVHYEKIGIQLVNNATYEKDTIRLRKRNVRLSPLDYEKAPDTELTPSESFRINEYLPIIDTYTVALDERIAAYETADSRFGFLSELNRLTQSEIAKNAQNIINIYKSDFESSLEIELLQFQEFCKIYLDFDSNGKKSKEQAMYSCIIEKGVQDCFPNVETLLKLYLTLMISNCSGERSFSKLKRIKNENRTSMTERRLNNLTRMSSEWDILRGLDVDHIRKVFADKKVRKVNV